MSWIFKTTEKSIALRPIRKKNFAKYKEICKILAEDEIELDVVPMGFEDDIVAPEDMSINFDLKRIIKEALELLSPREAKVLTMRFGIGIADHTLEEVGRQFDVGRERIRKIEIKALRKLRHLAPELICFHDQYAA